MEIKKEVVSPISTKFVVQIGAEEVANRIDQWLVGRAASVRVSGFRPGKAPLSIVRQRYLDEAESQVVHDLVQEAVRKKLDEENLKPAVRPQYSIDSYERGGALAFTFTVDVEPIFEIQDLKALKVEKVRCDITDTDVDEAYERFSQNFQKPIAVKEALGEGDAAVISVKTIVGGKRVEAFSSEEMVFPMQPVQDEFLEKIRQNILGKKAGESVEIRYTMSKHFRDKRLAHKKIIVQVNVTEVRRLAPASFTDEEAEALGYKDMAAVRERLKERLVSDREAAVRLCHKRAVLDALADAYQFEVPASLVESDFRRVWQYVAPELAAARASDDEEVRGKTDEEVAKEYRDVSDRRVRLGFVIDKIAKAHKITVTEEQITEAIRREVQQNQGHEAEVVRFYQKHPQAINQLLTPLLEDLVVNKVLEMATTTEKKMEKEAFLKRLEEVMP